MKILIVDDYASSRMTVRLALEAQYPDASFTECTDGEFALAAVTGPTLPDLIVTDYEMPRLDGFGLAEKLHSLPTSGRTCAIPIVLVSGSDPNTMIGKPSPGMAAVTMQAKARRHGVALCPKPVAMPSGSAKFPERLAAAIHEAQAIVAPLRRAG